MTIGKGRTEQRQEIATRIEKFKNTILTEGADKAFDEYVLKPNISIIGQQMETELRQLVAAHFEVDETAVIIVGSSKLGFSPKPGQYFKYFSSQSDIDIAIVSQELFSTMWADVFAMEKAGVYFNYAEFKHYHFGGWMRPDKLPGSRDYQASKNWWEFFNKLSAMENFGRLQIRGGLYYNMFFLRQYQISGLVTLREYLLAGEKK